MSDDEDEWDWEDGPCPKCGEHAIRSQHCTETYCDDGYCDEYEDDPINFAPGEEYTMCQECLGTGIIRWCSKCGCDITQLEYGRRAQAEGEKP